jgi:NTE family protein
MIETMTGFYDHLHVDKPEVQARTIFADTMAVRATDFDLDQATQQQLYDDGRNAAVNSSTAATVKRPGTGRRTWPRTARPALGGTR